MGRRTISMVEYCASKFAWAANVWRGATRPFNYRGHRGSWRKPASLSMSIRSDRTRTSCEPRRAISNRALTVSAWFRVYTSGVRWRLWAGRLVSRARSAIQQAGWSAFDSVRSRGSRYFLLAVTPCAGAGESRLSHRAPGARAHRSTDEFGPDGGALMIKGCVHLVWLGFSQRLIEHGCGVDFRSATSGWHAIIFRDHDWLCPWLPAGQSPDPGAPIDRSYEQDHVRILLQAGHPIPLIDVQSTCAVPTLQNPPVSKLEPAPPQFSFGS